MPDLDINPYLESANAAQDNIQEMREPDSARPQRRSDGRGRTLRFTSTAAEPVRADFSNWATLATNAGLFATVLDEAGTAVPPEPPRPAFVYIGRPCHVEINAEDGHAVQVQQELTEDQLLSFFAPAPEPLPLPDSCQLPPARPERTPQTRVRSCSNCGTHTRCHSVHDLRNISVVWQCSSCRSRYSRPCCDCGVVCLSRDVNTYEVHIGQHETRARRICISCANSRYRYCTSCEACVPLPLAVRIGLEHFCSFCANTVRPCDGCSRTVRRAGIQQTSLHDAEGNVRQLHLGECCRQSLICCGHCDNYMLAHDGQPHPRLPRKGKLCGGCARQLRPAPTAPNLSSRTFRKTLHYRNAFGIELECYAPQDCIISSRAFTVGSDGSIVPAPGTQAVEYRSRILQGDAGISALRRFLREALRQQHAVNNSCGTHVHIDASGYSNAQLLRIAACISHFDTVLFALQDLSRWENRFCRAFVYPAAVNLQAEGLEFFQNVPRYRGANFAAFFEHGTIEFRYHSGTLDFRRLYFWIRLLLALVNRGAAQDWDASNRLPGTPEALDEMLTALQLPRADCAYWQRQPLLRIAGIARVQS